MYKSVVVYLFSILMFLPTSWSQSPLPSIDTYGQLPEVSKMTISPDGEKIAFIQRSAKTNVLRVLSLSDMSNGLYTADIRNLIIDRVSWAGNKHVILNTSDVRKISGFDGKLDYTSAYAANIESKDMMQLLSRADGIFVGQSGLGRIVSKADDSDEVFMPAFIDRKGNEPTYSLLRANMDKGRADIVYRGTPNTIDWFIDTDGTALAREEYDNKTNKYQLLTKRSGEWETVLEYETARGPNGLVGVTPDRSALVYFLKNEDGYNELRRMGFNGEFGAAEMARPNTEINNVMIDANRVVFGVAYGGLTPDYDFFDKSLATDFKGFQEQVPGASVRLASWSKGFQKLIIYVEGGGFAGNYFLFDRKTSDIRVLAGARPDIPAEHVAEVLTMEYSASDGLNIPGIITVPQGSEIQKLPAIIMPHGGPESHDEVGFDWMAQYFASRGYLVFQPNFRGSDGFGTAFTEAGYGGWGGVMQQDITDGVAELVKSGMIDADNMCIVGWSYGGYAALAGGAFTPELYKCIAAIAPVSDLPKLLIDEKNDHGRDHWVVSYWERAIAEGDATRDTLNSKSPVNFAESFKAPVLLIHGKDDLTVKYNQSTRMRSALRKAKKDVTLVPMKGEDHSLSTPGARLEALIALDAFVAEHIGPHPNGG